MSMQIMLIHGWVKQERLVARNKSGEAVSIPVDKEQKLKQIGNFFKGRGRLIL